MLDSMGYDSSQMCNVYTVCPSNTPTWGQKLNHAAKGLK